MLIESANTLFVACPLLYRGRELPLSKNLIPLGVSCSDGWAAHLLQYSQKLEAHLQSLVAAGVPLEEVPMAVQVREENGVLRVYLSAYDEVSDAVVREIAFHSESICEICGVAGGFVEDSKRTLCRRHAHVGRRARR